MLRAYTAFGVLANTVNHQAYNPFQMENANVLFKDLTRESWRFLNTVGIVPSEGVFHRNVTQVVSGGKLTLPMGGNCAVAASLDNLDFLPSKDWHLQSRST